MSSNGDSNGPVTPDVQHGQQQNSNRTSKHGFDEAAAGFKGKTKERFSTDQPETQKTRTNGETKTSRTANLGNLPSRRELEARSGNYIISFGFAGAGKSCFQSHLVRWIMEGESFVPHVARTDSNDASTRLINIWRDDWRNNQFPDPTIRGESNVTELRIQAVPTEGQKTQIIFNFLEISGEDLISVIPVDGAGTMLGALSTILSNPKIKPMMVFFIDPDRKNNDTMFLNLLDYMDANFRRVITERISIIMVVPKPKTALAELRQSTECRAKYHSLDHVEELNTDLVELFLELTIPATLKRVKSWPGQWEYARFHMGDPIKGSETHFENVSFEDVSKIFSWIYRVFTGKKLGRSNREKLAGFFNVTK